MHPHINVDCRILTRISLRDLGHRRVSVRTAMYAYVKSRKKSLLQNEIPVLRSKTRHQVRLYPCRGPSPQRTLPSSRSSSAADTRIDPWKANYEHVP